MPSAFDDSDKLKDPNSAFIAELDARLAAFQRAAKDPKIKEEAQKLAHWFEETFADPRLNLQPT